jgi:hypothetical protein
MEKPPSRVGRWLNPWKRLSDASTADWLWNILPSSVVAVIGGVWAYLENLPPPVIALIALAGLALASFIAAQVRVYRAHSPRAEEEAERIYRIKRAEAEAEDRIRRERASRLLTGGIGAGNVLEDIEADRKAEAEARRVRMIREASEPPPAPKFDMPLKAVLERIAFESEWAITRDWSSPADHWQQTMWEKPLAKELLRPLASGDIPSRGIKSTSEGDEHGHSDIPADFWRNAKLTGEADRLLLEPGFDFAMMFGEGLAYHDIRLRRVDVDREWPARSAEDILARPSPFVRWAEERKAEFEETEINSRMEYEEMRARAAAQDSADSRKEDKAKAAVLPPEQLGDVQRGRYRNCSLSEAMGWAVYGEWGKFYSVPTIHIGLGTDPKKLLARFTCLAAEGRLTIWGKRDDPGYFEKIPQSHWEENQLTIADMFGSIVASGDDPYRDLMLNRAEVERAWPHDG